jgi:hypothetical protein
LIPAPEIDTSSCCVAKTLFDIDTHRRYFHNNKFIRRRPGLKLYDDGELGLVAATRSGIVESPVPVFLNGSLVGGFKTVEAYNRVPGTRSYPLSLSTVVANGALRLTYQKLDGTSGRLGTSLIGAPSFRTPSGLELIPTVARTDVTTGVPRRCRVAVQGDYESGAQVTSTSAFPDPIMGKSSTKLDVAFVAVTNITLAAGQPFVGNDRFRMLTLSSMWSSASAFDANLLRFEDTLGTIRTFALSAATPRDAHLLAVPIEVGAWIELVKTPGSKWFPDSPSIRISIGNAGGMRLGVQGFLAATTNPSDDSLSAWLEWLDAPDVINAETTLCASFDIAAFPVAQAACLESTGCESVDLTTRQHVRLPAAA